MAKSKEKNTALLLRQKGESIKDISEKLHISKSTVSLWCRDISLSSSQIENLHKKMIKGGYKGRIKGARIQHEKRLLRMDKLKEKGYKLVGKISDRDLLIAGIALYCGEGAKKMRRVKFTNSDPLLIKFMIRWFRKIWKVKEENFRLTIFINKIHKNRVGEVLQYWSKVTGIQKDQFTKTILIKAKNRKKYDNFPVHYGTLNINICKSSELQYLLYGLMEALSRAGE